MTEEYMREGFVTVSIPKDRALDLAKIGRGLEEPNLTDQATDTWADFHDTLVGAIQEQAPDKYRELQAV